jgi:phosphoribosylformylglycinamidine synthase
MTPKAIVVTGYGFNSDVELAKAFELAGAAASRVHLADLLEKPALIREFDLLGVPGGFSFGDHLGSGKEIANLLMTPRKKRWRPSSPADAGHRHLQRLQVLSSWALVPNPRGKVGAGLRSSTTNRGAFIDRWTPVAFEPECPCVWTKGLDPLDLPLRHGEGRFIAPEPVLDTLEKKRLVALRYLDNPNGSMRADRRHHRSLSMVLGLMPQPGMLLVAENHPRWQRGWIARTGLAIIRKGVEAATTA